MKIRGKLKQYQDWADRENAARADARTQAKEDRKAAKAAAKSRPLATRVIVDPAAPTTMAGRTGTVLRHDVGGYDLIGLDHAKAFGGQTTKVKREYLRDLDGDAR